MAKFPYELENGLRQRPPVHLALGVPGRRLPPISLRRSRCSPSRMLLGFRIPQDRACVPCHIHCVIQDIQSICTEGSMYRGDENRGRG
jgi:hypothetical protein